MYKLCPQSLFFPNACPTLLHAPRWATRKSKACGTSAVRENQEPEALLPVVTRQGGWWAAARIAAALGGWTRKPL